MTVAVLAVILWWLGSLLVFVIPTPADTFSAFWHNLGDPGYLVHVRATFFNVAIGYIIGIGVGCLVGIGLGLSRRARLIFQPLVLGGYAVPKIVIYPLVIPYLTIGSPSKIFMAALIASFPVLIIVTGATVNIPPVYHRLARSLEASRAQLLFKIVLPAIRRPVVTGMRVGASMAVLGVILAEFFITRFGLGRIIRLSYETGRHVNLFATMLLIFAFTFVVSFALWRLERRLD